MKLKNIESENFGVKPDSVYSFFDNKKGIVGYLVIDSNINGISGGGIRIVPRIAKFELSNLARAMTLKYSFLNMPLGGAKAAIITNREKISEENKEEYIKLFSKNLIPFKNNY